MDPYDIADQENSLPLSVWENAEYLSPKLTSRDAMPRRLEPVRDGLCDKHMSQCVKAFCDFWRCRSPSYPVIPISPMMAESEQSPVSAVRVLAFDPSSRSVELEPAFCMDNYERDCSTEWWPFFDSWENSCIRICPWCGSNSLIWTMNAMIMSGASRAPEYDSKYTELIVPAEFCGNKDLAGRIVRQFSSLFSGCVLSHEYEARHNWIMQKMVPLGSTIEIRVAMQYFCSMVVEITANGDSVDPFLHSFGIVIE